MIPKKRFFTHKKFTLIRLWTYEIDCILIPYVHRITVYCTAIVCATKRYFKTELIKESMHITSINSVAVAANDKLSFYFSRAVANGNCTTHCVRAVYTRSEWCQSKFLMWIWSARFRWYEKRRRKYYPICIHNHTINMLISQDTFRKFCIKVFAGASMPLFLVFLGTRLIHYTCPHTIYNMHVFAYIKFFSILYFFLSL